MKWLKSKFIAPEPVDEEHKNNRGQTPDSDIFSPESPYPPRTTDQAERHVNDDESINLEDVFGSRNKDYQTEDKISTTSEETWG